VVEESAVIEYQLKEQLYNWTDRSGRDVRPRIVGKFDESGEWPAPHNAWLLPPTAELTPSHRCPRIASRIGRFHTSEKMQQRLAFLEAKEPRWLSRAWRCRAHLTSARGGPHNQSTRVPKVPARWAASAAT